MAFTKLPGVEIYEIGGIEGAAFMLDLTGPLPVASLFPFLSSTDASQLNFSVQLPDGVTLGARADREFGFKWPMSNGWELWALDSQASKVTELLGHIDEGWRFVFRMPKGDFPATDPDDVYRIDKLVMSGHHEFYNFFHQPPLPPEDAEDDRPEHIVNSLLMKHKTKHSNVRSSTTGVLFNDYKIGNAGFVLPPMGYARNSVTGEVGPPAFGFWEKSALQNGDHLGTKCWDKATMQAALAAAPAGWDEVLVDATIGYTGDAATSRNSTNSIWFNDISICAAGGAAAIDSLHVAAVILSGDGIRGGIYKNWSGVTNETSALLWDNGFSTVPGSSSGSYMIFDLTSEGLSVSGGDTVINAVAASNSTSRDLKYDTTAGVDAGWDAVADISANPFPATATITTPSLADSSFGLYVTTSVATLPPVTTNAAVDPTSVAQGETSDLSADITDADHTIDEAEYFIGADPGEGSGTDMDLGAGTTSREATKTITGLITAGLAVDDHTVSVRGHDATDGWGAVDTVVLTVTEAVATSAGGVVGMFGVGKVGLH